MTSITPVRGLLSALAFLFAASFAAAQPSGGPYGPIRQVYEVPAGAAHVYFVAPNGSADAKGASVDAPTTFESAIARVVTGDAIIMRGGVYRTGGLMMNQGITIQPLDDEVPIVKGTLVASAWTQQENGLWVTEWKRLFPARPAGWWRRHREGAKTPPWIFNNDMVFVDGRPLQAVGWEGALDENSFFIDYQSGTVYLSLDPTSRVVEVTAQDSALTRTTGAVHGKASDKKGPTIRGITFTQYAYRALEFEGTNPDGITPESGFGKDVVGTTLEHVTITHCSRVAAYLRGDRLTVRNCLISDTSTEGLFILSSNDVLLEKNIFRRNNVEKITGYYPSAVKIFNQTHRVVCRDNLVTDNRDSNGIWYDVGNSDGVFVNNWIEESIDGFFFEISQRAICAGNVFVRCDKGVRVLNSADVRVHNNTFVDTRASFERTTRSAAGDHFDWHPATGPGVDERDGHEFVNNLLFASEDYTRPLLNVEQTASLCDQLTRPQFAALDTDVFLRAPGGASAGPLLMWSPAATPECSQAYATVGAFSRDHAAFMRRSTEFHGFVGTLFRNALLQRYEVAVDSPAAGAGAAIPEDVLKALGWSAQPDFAGAYAPGR